METNSPVQPVVDVDKPQSNGNALVLFAVLIITVVVIAIGLLLSSQSDVEPVFKVEVSSSSSVASSNSAESVPDSYPVEAENPTSYVLGAVDYKVETINEAVSACYSKIIGATCNYDYTGRAFTGTCKRVEGLVACVSK